MAKSPSSSEHRIVGAATRASSEEYRGLDRLLEGCQVIGFDWTYVYVNDALIQQARRSRDELLGRTMLEIYPGIERTPLFDQLRDCMRNRTSHALENEFTYPDGSQGWFELRIQPVPAGVLILSLDISERKRGVAERERLEGQLRQAQKMEAIGRLAGNIAHDFNNLLSVVRGYAELVRDALAESDPLRADLEQLCGATEAGEALTRQLLSFSRHRSVAVETLDLNAILASLEPMLARLLGADIDLSLRLAPDLGAVRGDASQLQQVVMNLVVNARDALPMGGRLAIETADVELDENYAEQHAGVSPGPYVVLVVADSGVGMDAATRERLFEPFFTTKPEGKGTGLGLATVYGIVQQCRGHVWVYSEPGRGTTFRIYLPRESAVAERRAGPRRLVASRSGSGTVLVVEDEPALRQLIERILGTSGYTVLTAADGAEALRVCAAHPGEVHLLLTDVVLPGLGGVQLAEALRRAHPVLRVLFMSGYAEDAAVEPGLLDAETRFLGKPFTAADLTACVRALLDA